MTLRARLADPIFWNDVTQLVKTALAAAIAWVLATSVFELEQPFLAPWAALLVVNSTVFRTISQGGRQVGATVTGVLVASGVGHLLGLDAVSIGVVIVLGLALGALPWFDGERTTAAATALVVLATGFSDDDGAIIARLLDTAVGIGVGIAVNMVVWPPLRRRTALRAMDRIDDLIGELLVDMADGLRGAAVDRATVDDWIQRTRDLDSRIDAAWALVRQAVESARLNPRRSARTVRDPRQWHDLLRRMEQANAEVRSLGRTLGHSLDAGRDWPPDFRDRFAGLLHDSGTAICRAEEGPLIAARAELDELIETLTAQGLSASLWPEYGGVLTNVRNVIAAMEEVAGANPLGQPPLPFQEVLARRREGRSRVHDRA